MSMIVLISAEPEKVKQRQETHVCACKPRTGSSHASSGVIKARPRVSKQMCAIKQTHTLMICEHPFGALNKVRLVQILNLKTNSKKECK